MPFGFSRLWEARLSQRVQDFWPLEAQEARSSQTVHDFRPLEAQEAGLSQTVQDFGPLEAQEARLSQSPLPPSPWTPFRQNGKKTRENTHLLQK